ncbi:hypothetical protein P7C70_g4761, partial [Phenoliferia sp. Uapishka_3]
MPQLLSASANAASSDLIAAMNHIACMERITATPAAFLVAQSRLPDNATAGELVILDSACGGAIITRLIFEEMKHSKADIKVISGDLVPANVEVARMRIAEAGWNAEATVFDHLAIPYPVASFDYVFVNFGIQFLLYPELAIKEFYRVLKPGGRVSLSIFTAVGAVDTVLSAAPEAVVPPIFNAIWTDSSFVRERLEQIGFEAVQVEELAFDVPFERVADFMDVVRTTRKDLFSDGVGEKVEKWLQDRYGNGPYVCTGFKALIVTGVKE